MAVEAHWRSLDRILYPLVYMLNRNSCMTFNKLLYLFSLRLNGIGISWPGRHGINLNEERFLRSIAGRLASGIVFDVGANTGQFATALRSHCPTAQIFCFEPHPDAYRVLEGKVGQFSRTFNLAVSNRIGRATLYECANAALTTVSSLEERTLERFGGAGRALEVDTITIEAICEQYKIEKINLLKIDTEGHDLAVLEGAGRLIKNKAIDFIEFEFVPACIVTKVNMMDFFDLLTNYRIFRLGLNGRLVDIGPYDYRFCEIYSIQHLIAISDESK